MKKIVLILIIFINLIGYANKENNENGLSFYKKPYMEKEINKKLNSLKKEIDNESIKFYNEGILRIRYQEELNKQSEELLNDVYSSYIKKLKTKDEKNRFKSSQKKWLKERKNFRKQIAIDALYDPTIPKNEQEINIKDADIDGFIGLENEYVYLIGDSLIILDRVEVLLKGDKKL